MIDFADNLVNPFNITYVEKKESSLSGGLIRVVLHLACGNYLVDHMSIVEYSELEEMLTDLIMGEEDGEY